MGRYSWSRLNTHQVGRFAEYFVKMEFALYGFEVYTAAVDDRGIDFIARYGASDFCADPFMEPFPVLRLDGVLERHVKAFACLNGLLQEANRLVQCARRGLSGKALQTFKACGRLLLALEVCPHLARVKRLVGPTNRRT